MTQTSPDGPTLHGPAPGGPAFAVGHGDHAVAGGCCGGAVDWLPADEAEEIAHQLAAVADPVRLQMLSIIARAPRGEVCACDFVGPIEKSQPTISHHLKVLAEAGLVEGEKRGRWVWYQLSPSALTGLLGSVTRATSAPASSVPTAD